MIVLAPSYSACCNSHDWPRKLRALKFDVKGLLYLRRQLLYGPTSMKGQLFPSHCHEITLLWSLISSVRTQAQFETPPPLTVVVPE